MFSNKARNGQSTYYNMNLKDSLILIFKKVTSMYTTNVCYEALMHNITPKDIENKET